MGLNSYPAPRELELDAAVRRVLSGDATAFRRVVDSTAPQLYKLAARLMGDAQEAEDVLQESYCRAFEALTHARFEGRSSLMTWLYRIVSNAALDALRSRTRNQRPAEKGGFDNVLSLPSVDGHLALRELSEWMADLRPEQRTALVLKELQGLTAAEVGQVMQCSEGAVEQHLVRARAILRARRQDD